MEHQRYADYHVPRTLLGRWRMRWTQWRMRARQKVPDGRDYTGWRARIVELPVHDIEPGVGTEGVVVEHQGDGARRVHYIEFPGATWVMGLPTRYIELTPPQASAS